MELIIKLLEPYLSNVLIGIPIQCARSVLEPRAPHFRLFTDLWIQLWIRITSGVIQDQKTLERIDCCRLQQIRWCFHCFLLRKRDHQQVRHTVQGRENKTEPLSQKSVLLSWVNHMHGGEYLTSFFCQHYWREIWSTLCFPDLRHDEISHGAHVFPPHHEWRPCSKQQAPQECFLSR